MANGNTVTIVGNITRDPEVRFTKAGTAIAKFGVAYNHRKFNNQSNEWDEEVHFFDVTAWKTLAENVGSSLSKGDRVVVEGRLDHQQWEDDDGNKRSKVEIQADEIAPSLRWATVAVTRNPKGDNSSKPSAKPSEPVEDEEPF